MLVVGVLQMIKTSARSLIVLLVVFLSSELVHAYSPSRPRTLPMLLASADAIVVVEMSSITPVTAPAGMPSFWTVDCRFRHALRGSVPETFHAHVPQLYVQPSSMQPGAAAIVFTNRMQLAAQHESTSLAIPPGGFLPIDGLVHPGDKAVSAVAFAAISAAIRAYQPNERNAERPWDIILNDEAARPLVELLNADSVGLRRWALSALSGAHPKPLIGNALVDALKDEDGDVRAAAAQHLMRTRYHPGTKPLRDYADRISREKPELAAAVKCYLHGRRLKEAIGELNDEIARPLKADVARIIGPGTPRVEIEVLMEDDKRIEIKTAFYSLSEETVSHLKNYFRLAPIPLVNHRAHFVMFLWLEDDKIVLELDNKCAR